MTTLRRTFTSGARSTACALALIVAMSAAGCGDDSSQAPFAPDNSLNLSRIVAFEPVPTDLVLAIDVSDSTSAEELSATIAALLATLGDPGVFDPAGSAAIAIIAYGDTTANVVAPLTVFDTTSSAEIFAPALSGLEVDRGVTGGTAVLDEALELAATLLGAGTSGNAHILMIGGGQDVDAAVITARCADLASAAIQFHAVGLGASTDAATLLGDCATATGGSFVDAADPAALDGAVQTVLSRITVVQLELLPDTAELDRGAEHVVTAKVTRGSGDSALLLEGLDVEFEVTAGPSVGTIDTVATDAEGMASFSLIGTVPPGTDTIVARVAHPDGDVTLIASVSVTWLNLGPECSAGGPYLAMVDSDTARVLLDASGSLDAEGDVLSFAWSAGGEGIAFSHADSAMTEVILTGAALCAESIEITLEVSDGFEVSTCVATIDLDDQRAPVLVAKDETLTLWSPNHSMILVTPDMVLESVEDACGTLGFEDVVVLSVTSDEAFDARGSGRTAPDVMIGCDGSVQLRAERTGGGDGRVYTIEYAVTDEAGVAATLEVEVHVPHDQSGRAAVAGDVMETVMADCEESAR